MRKWFPFELSCHRGKYFLLDCINEWTLFRRHSVILLYFTLHLANKAIHSANNESIVKIISPYTDSQLKCFHLIDSVAAE